MARKDHLNLTCSQERYCVQVYIHLLLKHILSAYIIDVQQTLPTLRLVIETKCCLLLVHSSGKVLLKHACALYIDIKM